MWEKLRRTRLLQSSVSSYWETKISLPKLWRGSHEDKSRIVTEVHDSRMTDNGYKLHQKRFLLDIGKTKQIVFPSIIGACYSARLWSLHSWVFARPDLIKPWANCSVLTGNFALRKQLAIRPSTILSLFSSSLIPRYAKNIKVKSILWFLVVVQQKPVLGARKIILHWLIPFWSLYKEYCK